MQASGCARARCTSNAPLPHAAVQAGDPARQRRGKLQQGGAAAGDHAVLHRGADGVDRVLDQLGAALLLDGGGAAGVDDGGAAGQPGQPLLQLVALDVGRGGGQLPGDLLAAGRQGPRGSRCRR